MASRPTGHDDKSTVADGFVTGVSAMTASSSDKEVLGRESVCDQVSFNDAARFTTYPEGLPSQIRCC